MAAAQSARTAPCTTHSFSNQPQPRSRQQQAPQADPRGTYGQWTTQPLHRRYQRDPTVVEAEDEQLRQLRQNLGIWETLQPEEEGYILLPGWWAQPVRYLGTQITPTADNFGYRWICHIAGDSAAIYLTTGVRLFRNLRTVERILARARARPHDWTRGYRFGEAQNPGPPSRASPVQCSSPSDNAMQTTTTTTTYQAHDIVMKATQGADHPPRDGCLDRGCTPKFQHTAASPGGLRVLLGLGRQSRPPLRHLGQHQQAVWPAQQQQQQQNQRKRITSKTGKMNVNLRSNIVQYARNYTWCQRWCKSARKGLKAVPAKAQRPVRACSAKATGRGSGISAPADGQQQLHHVVVDHDWKHGVRIGEAQQPGPPPIYSSSRTNNRYSPLQQSQHNQHRTAPSGSRSCGTRNMHQSSRGSLPARQANLRDGSTNRPWSRPSEDVRPLSASTGKRRRKPHVPSRQPVEWPAWEKWMQSCWGRCWHHQRLRALLRIRDAEAGAFRLASTVGQQHPISSSTLFSHGL